MADENLPPDTQKQNVVKLRPSREAPTKNEDAPMTDRMLQEAIGKLSGVIILGYTAETDEMEYFATSMDDCAEIVWLMERFKHHLLSETDGL